MLHEDLKDRARRKVRDAVKSGKLVPASSCEDCGKIVSPASDGRRGIHAHHYLGYDKPLDVQWLCPKCHFKHDPRPKGEEQGRAKLTEEAVAEIRAAPPGQGAIFIKKFGINSSTVANVRNGRGWKHVPGARQARAKDGSLTHCPAGHEYVPETMKVNNLGYKICLLCKRKRELDRYYKNRDHVLSQGE